MVRIVAYVGRQPGDGVQIAKSRLPILVQVLSGKRLTICFLVSYCRTRLELLSTNSRLHWLPHSDPLLSIVISYSAKLLLHVQPK